MNITILGSGAFGLAMAHCFHIKNNKITIWNKFEEEINTIKDKYPNYTFTTNMKDSLLNTNIIIIAIPIEFINDTLKELKKYYQKGIILITTKGISTKTKEFAYQMLEKALPKAQYGILSGGTFAKDIKKEKIMGLTLATKDKKIVTIIKIKPLIKV